LEQNLKEDICETIYKKEGNNYIKDDWKTIYGTKFGSKIHKEKRPLNRASKEERGESHTLDLVLLSVIFLLLSSAWKTKPLWVTLL